MIEVRYEEHYFLITQQSDYYYNLLSNLYDQRS